MRNKTISQGGYKKKLKKATTNCCDTTLIDLILSLNNHYSSYTALYSIFCSLGFNPRIKPNLINLSKKMIYP